MRERYTRLRPVLAALVLLTLAFGIGCHHVTVTGTPPGVSAQAVANWYQAAGALKTIQDTVSGATNSAVSLKADFPSASGYQATLLALGKLSQTDIEAANYLKTVPQNWNQPIQTQLNGYFTQMSKTLQDATSNGITGVKNPQKQAEVNALIGTLTQAIQFGLTLTGGQ